VNLASFLVNFPSTWKLEIFFFFLKNKYKKATKAPTVAAKTETAIAKLSFNLNIFKLIKHPTNIIKTLISCSITLDKLGAVINL